MTDPALPNRSSEDEPPDDRQPVHREQSIRRLTKVEHHLEDMLLHLDAAVDEAGFMIAEDFDRIFGSVTGQGNGKRGHCQNTINAMLRDVRRELAKLDALEVV